MAVLGEIRKRPILLMGIIALALLAFLVNPDSLDKLFGKDPMTLGKVNGEKITREEYMDQLYILQQQAQQQGQPGTGLEEQAWQMMVQSKLIKQQFEKMGFEMSDDFFWNQLQYDPMFAQNPQNFDEKGIFKVKEIQKQVEELKNSGNVEMLNQWNKTRKSIEYRMMAREVFSNITGGITTGKKEVEEMMSQRDKLADIDFVKVDYEQYLAKNPIKVTTEDLANYIKDYPNTYKTDPSVNLGLVFFPSEASAADDAAAQKQINDLFTKGDASTGSTESFANTTNDSMFIALNSDAPFNPAFVNANQLPPTIKDWAAGAAVGQTFGPYKEQGAYVVSKMLGKKPSDSTLSRHILIAHKDSPAGQGVTRTKEQAKKLADSIGAIVKATPARFTEFVKLSDDPGSAQQGGSVGWTTPETPFVPEFLSFLANNGKGATDVVETQFGYHIINIEDKKSGAMTYKVANLVKAIKPSSATEAETDKKARRFIQQVQGKSFNEFVNLAKKNNYSFSNPKSVKRFDGQLQGVNSAKDEEIIKWAFDKKREKGNTEFFTVEGTGDKVVAFLNGKQDKGTVDPESVREQIEPVVKNKLAAKQIIAKIGKTTNLDQLAKTFASAKQSAQVNLLSPQVNGAMEPKVAGAAFGVAKGKTSNPVEGMTGVYVVTKKNETVNKQPGDVKQITQSITQQNSQMFGQAFLKSLQDNADIKDYRVEVWDKGQQQ